MTQLTREGITQLLERNDEAVKRALIHIKNRQTGDEKQALHTRHRNARGFMPQHARKGTDMALWAERTGFLTPKQIAYWRRKDSRGIMRIALYWQQLVEEAEKKLQAAG